jgi:hypothetical protein
LFDERGAPPIATEQDFLFIMEVVIQCGLSDVETLGNVVQ